MVLAMSARGTTRDSLLEVAETLVVEHGVGSLTFDKLAAKAGISKGGVLHHFHNKDELVTAMVERSVATWRRDLEAATESVAPGPARTLRGMIALCLGDDLEHWTEEAKRRCSVLTTAIVTDPDKVAPLLAFQRELRAEIERDDLLPGYADTVALAINGIWLGWSYGLQQVDEQRVQGLRRCLEHVLELGIANKHDQDASAEQEAK